MITKNYKKRWFELLQQSWKRRTCNCRICQQLRRQPPPWLRK